MIKEFPLMQFPFRVRRTGLRKSELFRLRWSGIDFDARQLLVAKSKTGEQRHAPLSRRALWLLRKMAARDPLATWAFQSEDRKGVSSPVVRRKEGVVRRATPREDRELPLSRPAAHVRVALGR
jgi:integrase